MRKFTIHVATDILGSECTETIEIEEEELEDKDKEAVIAHVYEHYVDDVIHNMIEAWVTENE